MTVARSVPRPARSACRLRFLVRLRPQTAPRPHGKAHSGLIDSRKAALCDSHIAQTAPFRYGAAPGRRGANPPPGCGALWRMAQLGKCALATPRRAAGRLARESANLGLEFGLTERRTLQPRCHQKAHSVPITSRKGAVWLSPHLDVPQHLTHYGIKDLFVASMKADDKVWEP